MRIAIGRVLKPHGIKGELKIFPETFDIERFYDLDQVYLEKGDKYQQYDIEVVRVTSDGKVFLKLLSVGDRNDAELLRGMIVSIDEEYARSLPEDTYYFHQLEGMTVYDRASEKEIGKIDSIVEAGSADLYIVKNNEIEYMIPAIKKFVKKVDVKNKRMEIESIPGLLDL